MNGQVDLAVMPFKRNSVDDSFRDRGLRQLHSREFVIYGRIINYFTVRVLRKVVFIGRNNYSRDSF